VDVEIFSVYQLRFPQHAFELEPQALRDGAALFIPRGAMDFDAVELPLAESMIDQHPAGRGNDTAPLESRCDPVTDFDLAIQPIDLVRADTSDEFVAAPDAGRESFVVGELVQRALDEAGGVVHFGSLVHPGKPLAQMAAVAIDGLERQRGRVSLPATEDTRRPEFPVETSRNFTLSGEAPLCQLWVKRQLLAKRWPWFRPADSPAK